MIVITGASRGLGKAIFESLKSNGTDCIGLARNADEKKNILECDVSRLDSIKKSANKIKGLCDNRIFALINVAGIASMNLALATPEKKTREIIETNLLGTIFTNQVFAPMLIRNKSGRIINFSTLAVKLGIKGESIYTASKAGVEAFSRTLARELSDFNVTVNCIAPGPIKTDLIRGVAENKINNIVKQQIFTKIFETKNIVEQVELLLSPNSRYLSGQVISLGGS